jgi:hypothetical protein
MTGRRTLFTLCWPIHPGMSNVLTKFFPMVFIELSSFLVCTQVIFWLFNGLTSIPRSDPYVPNARCPPSYLEPFLDWLSTTINATTNTLAPCMRVRRCCSFPCHQRVIHEGESSNNSSPFQFLTPYSGALSTYLLSQISLGGVFAITKFPLQQSRYLLYLPLRI